MLHAERIAAEYGHNYIGTEHLLIALAADPDGIAGQVLQDLGVRDDAASRTRSIIESEGYNRKPPSGTSSNTGPGGGSRAPG